MNLTKSVKYLPISINMIKKDEVRNTKNEIKKKICKNKILESLAKFKSENWDKSKNFRKVLNVYNMEISNILTSNTKIVFT